MSFFYNICIPLSGMIIIGFAIWAIHIHRHPSTGKRVLSALHIFTLGVFLACVAIHLPFYYSAFNFNDTHKVVRPVVLSILSSLQAFVLGFNFMDITDKMSENLLNPGLNAVYTFWIAVLYVVAPILTLTNILSLFKSAMNEWRIRVNRRRPVYIFSELNEQSLAMAQSITELWKDKYKGRKIKRGRPLIVFTDVYSNNEETDQELLQTALDMRAKAVKKDITRMNIKKRKCPIEFFLIGSNESENIEQAIKLNEDNKAFANRSVYIYSSAPEAGYIIDSLDKGEKCVSDATRGRIFESPQGFLDETGDADRLVDLGGSYYIRRVNSVNDLAVTTLTDDKLLTPLTKGAENGKSFSVVIVGLGLYGEAFLRNALWILQISGYRLNIYIIDKREKSYLKKRIKKQMPDIASCSVATKDGSLRYLCEKKGDSRFNINVYPGIDCETSDLADLFDRKKADADFKGAQLLFVTLGNDDSNIETAVELRRLFDRLNKVNEKSVRDDPCELPMVYSVVYDDRKAANLNCGNGANGIINHKKTPYHIHFIGKMSDQYNYTSIIDMKKTESSALLYHFEWIKNAETLREFYHCEKLEARQEALTAFKEAMVKYFTDEKKGKVEWGDEFLFKDGKLDAQSIFDSVNDYFSYEYYRESSIAKSIHKDMIAKYFQTHFDTFDEQNLHFPKKICTCEKCKNLKISEHMRWNAYMRTKGFIYSETRMDRAKTHNDLVPWDELPEPEKYKD